MEQLIKEIIYLIYDIRIKLSQNEKDIRAKSLEILNFISKVDESLKETLLNLIKNIKSNPNNLWTRNSLHDKLKENHLKAYCDYIKQLKVKRYLESIKK